MEIQRKKEIWTEQVIPTIRNLVSEKYVETKLTLQEVEKLMSAVRIPELRALYFEKCLLTRMNKR